jgi:molybdenum cofactor cytidylyltransferase
MNCGALILAAGESKRFDGVKQLAKVRGDTLLNRVLKEYKKAGCSPIYVALGANRNKIMSTLSDDVKIIIVNDWQQGMGYSLSKAIQWIEQQGFPQDDKLIVGVADQIDIDSDALQTLLKEAVAQPNKIVAASYNQIQGVPAIFGYDDLKELRELKDDKGARTYIKNNISNVSPVELPSAAIDIDTKEDLDIWQTSQK